MSTGPTTTVKVGPPRTVHEGKTRIPAPLRFAHCRIAMLRMFFLWFALPSSCVIVITKLLMPSTGVAH